jgi:leucyl aminopeptidase (aminopeptidase T)
MTDLELVRPMRVLVEEISDVSPDDTAVVITDDTRLEIAKALAGVLRSAGVVTAVTIIPREVRGAVEPPDMAGAIMSAADYAFLLTSNNIVHTDIHREAQAAGTEIAAMWGASKDLFLNGPSPENYEEVDRRISTLKGRLQETSRVRITTDAGTDVVFDIGSRPVIALGIKENDKSSVADFPQGEVAVAPVEGSATGTVVVDVGIDVVGLVETPIELEFEDGVVKNVEGDVEAAELRKMIDQSDDNATNLAEFAIGANDGARIVDHIKETKKKLGTIHLAIGDSNTIGGEVKSDLHIDGIVSKPTVHFDGEAIMEDGTLLI